MLGPSAALQPPPLFFWWPRFLPSLILASPTAHCVRLSGRPAVHDSRAFSKAERAAICTCSLPSQATGALILAAVPHARQPDAPLRGGAFCIYQSVESKAKVKNVVGLKGRPETGLAGPGLHTRRCTATFHCSSTSPLHGMSYTEPSRSPPAAASRTALSPSAQQAMSAAEPGFRRSMPRAVSRTM